MPRRAPVKSIPGLQYDGMRVGLRIFIFALAGGITLCAQTEGTPSTSATAHIGKGYELVQNDRYAEAAKEFRAALALDPGAIQARYQLAVCLFALGERDESRREFERLGKETGNDPSIAYYLARLDMLAGDSTGAIRRFVPLMAHPPFSDAAFYLGSAYLAAGDLEQAIQWLRKAAETDPRDFRIHYRLARALGQKGLHEESEQEYARSTEMRERYNDTARQSVGCVQALRAESATAARESCRRLFDPNDADKLTTLGILFGENGKYGEAIEPLQRAAQLDSDSSRPTTTSA